MVPSESLIPLDSRWALTSLKIILPRSWASRRWRNLQIVLSSGTPLVAEVYANKSPHGSHVVERFFGSGVAEVEVNSAGNGSEASVPALWEVCPFPAWGSRVL